DLYSNLAPNYSFMLGQGLGAVQNLDNSTGSLVSGNTLRDINNYAQDYAGNAYQNAFNNYTTNQSNIFNRLATIAGLGQGANQITANSGTTLGTGIAGTQQAAGAAQAAGTVGSMNALTGGLNNAMGWYATPDMMKLFQ
ncbi:MAG: hypothetical protein KGI54_16885, partial [Pseudomonadota bacterium]|nr:hypothetical protein [Pseudomonadota bacterium]MDE3023497.1 hypothetical protein [Pseudomonadota bacterium]